MTTAGKIRLLLTAGLLVEVWLHSHWSVALTLTFLSIANEMQNYRLERKRDGR